MEAHEDKKRENALMLLEELSSSSS